MLYKYINAEEKLKLISLGCNSAWGILCIMMVHDGFLLSLRFLVAFMVYFNEF